MSKIVKTLGFFGGRKTETSCWVLNNFGPKFPLLVLLTVSGLLLRLPSASLVITVFNSYLSSFIVIFLTAPASLSDFSSLSLVKIVFGFFLCELDS